MAFDLDHHTTLIFLRLDLSSPDPLRAAGTDEKGRLERLDDKKPIHILAGILEHSPRRANAPPLSQTQIPVGIYNRIIDGIESLNERYFKEGGFVDVPDSYTAQKQKEIYSEIDHIGHLVMQLFRPRESMLEDSGIHPLYPWLQNLARASAQLRPAERLMRPVTIITNDFNIPWYWLKIHYGDDALCELCSLGTLRLSDMGDSNRTDPPPPEGPCPVLLIDGAVGDQESRDLMQRISGILTAGGRAALGNLTQVHPICSSRRDIDDFSGTDPNSEHAVRLLHFSGSFGVKLPKSGKGRKEVHLKVGGYELEKYRISRTVENSLLVIDGNSASRGNEAWTDIQGFTAEVISGRECALGCVLPVLPVKSDPIIGEIFWKAFYEGLGKVDCGAGFALRQARQALRAHVGKENPIYLFYQLLGSPLLSVFDHST